MVFRNKQLSFSKTFVFLFVLFMIGGITPVFSQEILATFGLGSEFIDHDKGQAYYRFGDDWVMLDETVSSGIKMDMSILLIGRTGLTISAGTDILFKIDNNDGGVNTDPIIGLGYVYYNKLYMGGILNAVPKPYLRITKTYDEVLWADVFITPTLVGGYDFGSFLLGGQMSYMFGPVSSISGFRFSLGVGVNVGNALK